MKITQRLRQSSLRRFALVLAMVLVATTLAANGGAIMMSHRAAAKRPAEAEFGLGPRISAQGRFLATLEPERALGPRELQRVRVVVTDSDGRAIEGAALSIDGGMPQHGHGLPTRPRVTQQLGAGVYLIEGVRFNMGGWWEFAVTIAVGDATDTVTFNLEL